MRKILIALTILVMSCHPHRDLEPEHEIVVVDDITQCAPTCINLRALDCPEGKDLVYPGSSCVEDKDCSDGICKAGKCTETCEMVCEAFVKQGVPQNLECQQKISACRQIESVCR